MYLLILFTTSRGVLINGNAWRNFGKFAIVSPPPPPLSPYNYLTKSWGRRQNHSGQLRGFCHRNLLNVTN